jgi:hypothetical protein
MGLSFTWNACCEEACETLQYVTDIGVSPYSVKKWNRQYRFPHSNKFVATGMKPEPKLFALFPEAKARLLSFAAANLDEFSIETVRKYMNETLIPDLLSEYNDGMYESGGDDDDCLEMSEFLEIELGLSSEGISESTVCRYLEHLNYRYDVRKKAYYVDGHEQEDVVKDRMKSVKRYLKDTLRCYEWVQVTKEQLQPLLDKAKKAKEEGKDKYLLSLKDAHVYSDKNGVEMYEFHVDASKDLQFVRPENKKYGGNLSIRIPDGVKPLLRV